MGSNNIIVREYLESLKEDGELDYLFPILLNIMGFRVVSTAKEAKGQSQYGKDIIAIGNDEKGVRHRYYFELKGHKDKDITDKNYSATDGVRESIIEAKDTAFNDSSIAEFNNLPVKIVFVHNGVLKPNIRPTFEGFISREFKEGEFERWDIYYLTDLFSDYLFNEYLLTDDESLRLFKRTLVMLDAPENDYRDFKKLVELQIQKIGKIENGRAFNKFFATQGLLCNVVLHYSAENENLYAAKECLTYLLLKTWAWVLREKLDKKLAVIREFRKLVHIHYEMLDQYFIKTLPTAILKEGLFSEVSGPFEEIGFPLRCFEYLNYLVYYFNAQLHFPNFNGILDEQNSRNLRRRHKDTLIKLIENNDGCYRALMDCNSITVLNVLLYFLNEEDMDDEDLQFAGEYVWHLLDNIVITKTIRDRFPLLINDEKVLVKAIAGKDKSAYEDRSSLLITILFEFTALLNANAIYSAYKSVFEGKINLQTAYPNFGEYDVEQLLFEKHLDQEYYVETNISLKNNLVEYKATIKEKEINSVRYRTDAAGLPFLRCLAHIYYRNEFFPDTWRNKFKEA